MRRVVAIFLTGVLAGLSGCENFDELAWEYCKRLPQPQACTSPDGGTFDAGFRH